MLQVTQIVRFLFGAVFVSNHNELTSRVLFKLTGTRSREPGPGPGHLGGRSPDGVLGPEARVLLASCIRRRDRRGFLNHGQARRGTKSDLRNHQAIVQPRLYDCLVVTQITLPRLYDCLMVTQITLNGPGSAAASLSGSRPG
jgi:hypothetical protein